MSTVEKNKLLLLYDRPKEPVFKAKGNELAVFDIPSSYLPDRLKPVSAEIFNRFGEEAQERVPVKEIAIPPIDDILQLGRDSVFTLFIPLHRKLAGRLISIFLGMRNVDDLLSVAVYTRDRVNPYLFNYALSVTLLHRTDTRDLDVPSLLQSFPDKMVDSKVITKAREEAHLVPENARVPIEIAKDYTASDLESEHRLAYWREDLGLNLHHWHWHLVYPFDGPLELVNKDRRGELFYYMHHQMQARYNFERFSNKFGRVRRWNNFRDPIPEAYFSKLDSSIASRHWPGRAANQQISDINRVADNLRVDISDLEQWRDRIFAAIHAGQIQNDKGQTIPLTEDKGIDILGNILESSILSPNRQYYGDLHNMGHVFLSYIHDPDHRHLEPITVIGDPAVTMRDPLFYPLHCYIDNIFHEFKDALPRYQETQLNYPGINVTKVEIQSKAGANQLGTFWQQSDIDLSRGMDFQPRGPVFVRFTHLQHQPFSYRIEVNNSSGSNKIGTCRIFLAPEFDERNNPWLFRDQRNMFIELDKFTVNLNQGRTTISRSSNQSAVTIPFERTFRDVDTDRPQGGDALEQFNFCGCGWPQHLLIPKGSPEGLPCHLFVMISNYDDDKVEQNIEGVCTDAGTYCGIKDKKYPDRRSMGYPFDRMPRDGVTTLQQFLTANMRVQDVTIRFTNRTVRPVARNK